MSEYWDVLERELERLSPPRIPIDRLARRRDRKRRNQRLAAAVVGIAVSLLAIGTFIDALREGDGTGTSPSPTVEPISEPSVLSLVDVSTGRARQVPESISTIPEAGNFEVSPDGSSLAFDAQVNADGIHEIFVGEVDGSNVHQLTSDVRVHARNPSWSPDSTKIVYEGRIYPDDGEIHDDLFVLDVSTGITRPLRLELRAIPYIDVHTPSFGPNGLKIVYTDFDPERDSIDLRSVPVAGGQSTPLVRRAAFGSISPDGRTLAYRRATTIPGIGMGVQLKALGGTTPPPNGGSDQVMGSLLQIDPSSSPAWSPSGRFVAHTDPVINSPRRIAVLDLVTGRVSRVGRGTEVAWLDDDTLIVRAYEGS